MPLLTLEAVPLDLRRAVHAACLDVVSGKGETSELSPAQAVQQALPYVLTEPWQHHALKHAFQSSLSPVGPPATVDASGWVADLDTNLGEHVAEINTCVATYEAQQRAEAGAGGVKRDKSFTKKKMRAIKAASTKLRQAANGTTARKAFVALGAACETPKPLYINASDGGGDDAKGDADESVDAKGWTLIGVKLATSRQACAEASGLPTRVRLIHPEAHAANDDFSVCLTLPDAEATGHVGLWLDAQPTGSAGGPGYSLRLWPGGSELPMYVHKRGKTAEFELFDFDRHRPDFGSLDVRVVPEPGPTYVDGTALPARPGRARAFSVRAPIVSTAACLGDSNSGRSVTCHGPERLSAFVPSAANRPPMLPPHRDVALNLVEQTAGRPRHESVAVDLSPNRLSTLLDVEVGGNCGTVGTAGLWEVAKGALKENLDDGLEFADVRGTFGLSRAVTELSPLLRGDPRRRDGRRRGRNNEFQKIQASEQQIQDGMLRLWDKGIAEVVQLHLDCNQSGKSRRYTVTARKLALAEYARGDATDSHALTQANLPSSEVDLRRTVVRVMRKLQGQPHIRIEANRTRTTVNRQVNVSVRVETPCPSGNCEPEDASEPDRIFVRAHRVLNREAKRICPLLESGDPTERARIEKQMAEGNLGALVPIVRPSSASGTYGIWPARGGTMVVAASLYPKGTFTADVPDAHRPTLRPERDGVFRLPPATERANHHASPRSGTTRKRHDRAHHHIVFEEHDVVASDDSGNAKPLEPLDVDYVCIDVEVDQTGPIWAEAAYGKSVPLGEQGRRLAGYGDARSNADLRRGNHWLRVRGGFDFPFAFRSSKRMLLGGSVGYSRRVMTSRGSPQWSDAASTDTSPLTIVRRSAVFAPHIGVTSHGCRNARRWMNTQNGRVSPRLFKPCNRATRYLYWRALASLDVDVGRIDMSEVPESAVAFRNGLQGEWAFDVDIGLSAMAVLGARISPHIALAFVGGPSFLGLDDAATSRHRGTVRDNFSLGWLSGLHIGGFL